MDDQARSFGFEHLPVRGVWVRLTDTWAAVLERHHYPAPVCAPLGHALAASGLLTALLKSPARVSLELRGDGPLRLLIAEALEDGALRAVARWSEPLGEGALAALLTHGQLLLSVDPARRGTRYQGVVELSGGDLAAALTHYFEHSEQLPTRVLLAADQTRVAGLLVQRLPTAGTPEEADAWQRISLCAASARPVELLELAPDALLRRLFAEDDVRLAPPLPLRFGCSCTLERVHGALRALGRDDVQALLAERGEVSVDCEFCNQHYVFDAAAVAGVFSPAPPRLH